MKVLYSPSRIFHPVPLSTQDVTEHLCSLLTAHCSPRIPLLSLPASRCHCTTWGGSLTFFTLHCTHCTAIASPAGQQPVRRRPMRAPIGHGWARPANRARQSLLALLRELTLCCKCYTGNARRGGRHGKMLDYKNSFRHSELVQWSTMAVRDPCLLLPPELFQRVLSLLPFRSLQVMGSSRCRSRA